MKNCIDASKFNIEPTEEALAKFIKDKIDEFRERSEPFGGIEASVEGIENFLNQEKPKTVESVIDENEPEKFLLYEELIQQFDEFEKAKDSSIETFILFNNEDKSSFTVEEVLNNIITNYSGYSPVAKTLIDALLLISKHSKAKIVFRPSKDKMNTDTFMQYNGSDNSIWVFPEEFGKHGIDFAVQSMLHEIVHSVTMGAYMNPLTFEQNRFKELIDIAFEYYKTNFPDSKSYGFKNPIEFIAEVYSNPVFQEELKSTNKGFWSNFINAIRRIFGLKVAADVNELIESILNVAPTLQFTSNFKAEKKVENEQDKKTLKNTPYERIHSLVDKLRFSITENIRRTKEMSKRLENSDPSASRYLASEAAKLSTVFDDVRNWQVLNVANSIAFYVDYMNKTLAVLSDMLENVDPTDTTALKKAVIIHSTYVTGFSIIDDINKDLAALENSKTDLISKEDISSLKQDLAIAVGTFAQIDSKLHDYKALVLKNKLKNIKYFPQVEKKHYNRLAKEHKENKIIENKETWIIKQMQGRDKALIEQDVEDFVNRIIDDPVLDIPSMDVMFSTPVNVASPLIQIMNQFLLEIETTREQEEREKDQQFKELFEKLKKEKGTNNPLKLYKNFIGYDRDGKAYLQLNYKAELYNYEHEHNDIVKKYKGLIGKQQEIQRKYSIEKEGSQEYLDAEKEIAILRNKRALEIIALKEKYFEKDDKNRFSDAKKEYIVDQSTLTDTEKEVRDFFVQVLEEGHKKTLGQDSLVINIQSAVRQKDIKLYELPKVTKSDVERILGGDIKGIATDKWKDLTSIRADDIEYGTIEKDQAGNVIRKLRVHYRDRQGNFDNKDQSLDLFGIMRLEYKNTNIFNKRMQAEMDLNFMLDVAKEKEYYSRTGASKLLNWRNNKFDTIKGIESKTFKMMNNLMESRFYDIMRTSKTKIGAADANKLVSFLNGSSAFLALSLNFASGTANVINANTQLFLESFIKGDFITAAGIAKANTIYGKHLPNTLNDVISPINSSYVNQVLEMFNVWGLFNLSHADFVKSDMVKKGLSRETLQIFQESGEHWIQSVTTMSVLEGIKVLNSKGEFINENGKVVKSEKEAASLLDMLKKGESGLVGLDKNVVYTTHSRLTKWDEGGREKVSQLLIKKINDTVGNYRRIDQPNVLRTPGGQLLMLYRKYFVPMGQARFRAWEHVLTPEDELSEDDKIFSYGLQEYEEGIYVSLARYIVQSLRDKKYYVLSRSNWNSLTDYQRHNIKRAITEFMLTFVMIPLATKLLLALAGDDPDDSVYFMAYQLRRLDTELSQYFAPSEAFKMIRSPIPSARLLETGLNIMEGVVIPWTWQEEYVQGPHKGESKLKVKIQKQIPVLKEFRRTFEDLYDYQRSTISTGL